jgi:ethanolamine utilization protein EutA
MAALLASALGLDVPDEDIAGIYLTQPLRNLAKVDEILLSGGVAEFFYQRETKDFGDLGFFLAQALRVIFEVQGLPWTLLPAQECIRATVLGASEYSLQLSGQTSTISSHAALLPRRNLPVLYPVIDFLQPIDPARLGQAIKHHRAAFDRLADDEEMVFAFRWRGEPSHERLLAFAQGLAIGLEDLIRAKTNLYIMLEGDAALSLGAILLQEIGIETELLILDGLVLRDFDYVDIGRMRVPSHMVPVTIKTLIFEPEQKKT